MNEALIPKKVVDFLIPSVLATQFREGLTDYVETTFPVTSPIFENSIRGFLEKKDAFFHEPFISVKMPFRIAAHGNERFEAIHSDCELTRQFMTSACRFHAFGAKCLPTPRIHDKLYKV